MARKAHEQALRDLGPEADVTAITRLNLMCVLESLGRSEDAAAQAPEVVELFERVFGPRHPNTATAKSNAARILSGVGRFDEADELYQAVVEIRRDAIGENHPQVAGTLTSLGKLRLKRGGADCALGPLEEARAMYAAAPGSPTLAAAHCRSLLGECLTKLARFDEAEPNLLEGQRGIEGASTASEVDKREAIRRVVHLYGAWNAAEPTAERAEQLATWEARLTAFPAGR